MASDSKFKTLIHYACWRCRQDPSKLGSVKLNKIAWLSDSIAFLNLGTPITSARYVRRQFGPVPSAILPVLGELEKEGSITIRGASHYGYHKKEFIAQREPSTDVFTRQELLLINQIIDFICEEHTAKSISEWSHGDVWQAALDGEVIPHYTVFARREDIEQEDIEWAMRELKTLCA